MVPMSHTAHVAREGNDWPAEVRDLPGAHAFAGMLLALRRELVTAGWSVRDVAGALGITAARVSQLTRQRQRA
jgi:hypothetical protein